MLISMRSPAIEPPCYWHWHGFLSSTARPCETVISIDSDADTQNEKGELDRPHKHVHKKIDKFRKTKRKKEKKTPSNCWRAFGEEISIWGTMRLECTEFATKEPLFHLSPYATANLAAQLCDCCDVMVTSFLFCSHLRRYRCCFVAICHRQTTTHVVVVVFVVSCHQKGRASSRKETLDIFVA